jgi:hypothetical protein
MALAGCGSGARAPSTAAPEPARAIPPRGSAEQPFDDEGPAPVTPAASGAPQVTIKLLADAGRQARVFWGRKDLGLAPLEIHRPRASGPLDLLVTAPGALPLHTRVFTDRDDVLSLRLYDEASAAGLLGYSKTFSLSTSPGFTHNAGTFPRPRR